MDVGNTSPELTPAGSATSARAYGVWKACASGTGVPALVCGSKAAAGVTQVAML